MLSATRVESITLCVAVNYTYINWQLAVIFVRSECFYAFLLVGAFIVKGNKSGGGKYKFTSEERHKMFNKTETVVSISS